MASLPGGVFTMGSDRFYPEERPARRVRVAPFRIDIAPVTNRAFARFVAATGYRTVAGTAPDPAHYPGLDPALATAGSLVFTPTAGPVDLGDPARWWRFRAGADWRHPLGPDSSLDGLEEHPVVHVAHADAAAFAAWAGKSLPTEAEWEYAARGGLDGADYAWGDEPAPGDRMPANIWRGDFPWRRDGTDSFARTSPVGAFPPNGHGLYDMIGNVWEWTDDWYAEPAAGPATGPKGPCCVIDDPRGGTEAGSRDPALPALALGRKVLKGGSHLCAPSYCRRYRPAARQAQAVDTATSHIGFRCVRREPA
jgi:formylglycine-generating enzyme required for sulfatase activity